MKFPFHNLESLTIKIGSGATPRGGDSVYTLAGTTLIRSQNVYNSEFTSNGLAFINDSIANQMKGVTVFEDDVLLNITGDSVARCCLVPRHHLPARVNQHVAIIRTDNNQLNARFLMYYLISPYIQRMMLSLAGAGGTRKALTKGMIQSFNVPKPDLHIQEKITDILSTYDDLIENNRRRIQLLEESASLLYREWFVHLRFPGHASVKVVDGVPEGWERKTITGLGAVVTGKTPSMKVEEYYGGDILFIKTPDMHGNTFVLKTVQCLTDQGSKQQQNKLLPENSILVSCIGTLGVVSMTAVPSQFNQQINAIIPAYPYYRSFIYFSMLGIKPRLEGFGSGATMGNVNKSKFSSLDILLPTESLLKEFEDMADTLLRQIKCLAISNIQLTQARDILLPRLMNGEIEV